MYLKTALFGAILAVATMGGCSMIEENEDDSQTIEPLIDAVGTIFVEEGDETIRVTEPADRVHLRFGNREKPVKPQADVVAPEAKREAGEFAPPVVRGSKG